MSVGLIPPTSVGFRTLLLSKFWTCVCLLCVLPVGLTSGKEPVFYLRVCGMTVVAFVVSQSSTCEKSITCDGMRVRPSCDGCDPPLGFQYYPVIKTSSDVQYKVRCSNDVMKVDLVKTDDIKQIYLDQLKNYPDKECHPQVVGNKATFLLSMTDIHRCGVTRISDKLRNKTMYYHRIIVEHNESVNPDKESFLVKCVIATNKMSRALTKRNVLPAGFQEPEDLEITTSLTEKAPEPILSAGVRQGKERITGEVNVTPGTPLTMEIYLDKSSAPIYGILVSFMQVTDTKQQEETIIFNGCSVDPYLFENFNTVDGDFLSAKFRAFKFPDSNYVQFKGTVNVCLDKCQGVQCSNGQIGYGRRRRSVTSMPADPNKIFEVSLTTFIKINFVNNTTHELKSEEIITQTNNSTEDLFILKEAKKRTGLITAKTERENQAAGLLNESNTRKLHQTVDSLNEEFKYSVIEEARNSGSLLSFSSLFALSLLVSLNILYSKINRIY